MGEYGPPNLEAEDAPSILASLPIGVVIADVHGHLSYSNLASARILGIDRTRLTEHTLPQALHVDDILWQHAIEEAQVMGEATMSGGESHLGDPVQALVAPRFGTSGFVVVLSLDPTPGLRNAVVSLAQQSLGRDALLRTHLLTALHPARSASWGPTDFKQHIKHALDAPNASAWDAAEVTHLVCAGHFGEHPSACKVNIGTDLTSHWRGAPESIFALLTALLRSAAAPAAPVTLLVDYDAPAQHVVWQLSPHHSGPDVDILVHTLAQSVGAEVLVEDHGIELRVPVTAAATTRGLSHAMPPVVPRRPRVLLVEDDAVTALLTIGRIEMHDVDVVHVHTCAEAVAHAHADKFDLVIVDASLPHTNARALVDDLHSLGPLRRPGGIFVCSGFSDGSLPASLADAPLDGVVSKPVTPYDIDTLLLPRLFSPASSESDDLPVLDPQTIGTLQALSPGQDLVNRVLTKFLDDLTESHPALAIALGDDDLHTIGRTAHRVKGAAATVGALRIESLCRQLEQAAKQGDRARLGAFIAALVMEGQQIELALADRYT